MADISAELVKELRERTGAGFMDCKRALAETGGDLEKAVALLREQGLAAAAKKAGRDAREGLVASYIHTGGLFASTGKNEDRIDAGAGHEFPLNPFERGDIGIVDVFEGFVEFMTGGGCYHRRKPQQLFLDVDQPIILSGRVVEPCAGN